MSNAKAKLIKNKVKQESRNETEEKWVSSTPGIEKRDRGKKFNIFNIIGMLSVVVSLVILAKFEYKIFKLNVLPFKYFALISLAISIVWLVLSFISIKQRSRIIKTLGVICLIVISGVSIIATPYLQNTEKFLQGTQVKKDFLSYSVLTLKDSNFDRIDDLKEKSISYLKDDYNDVLKANLKIEFKERVEEDFSLMTESFLEGKVDAIVLESGHLALAKDEIEDFEDKIKIIYEFNVEISNKIKPSDKDVKVSEESFILYISGIDQYGKVKSVRGRSDVNQLVVVNPNSKKVLIVNTPRDYYVQLHGTTGLKDKLTHAGVYGIEKSVTTLEDLYDTKINYYLRVNFNTLIKVVDVIGGIDVISDKAFTPHTDRSVRVVKGLNHFNGKAALAYARERYAYASGDRHRGENQQQVITAIIDKLTSSEVLMNKYNDILETLDGTFQTSMPVDKITSLIRFQLDKMPKWEINSIAVDGYNSSNYTYSMGSNRKLYVMEPNLDSVNKAKEKIKGVLDEN